MLSDANPFRVSVTIPLSAGAHDMLNLLPGCGGGDRDIVKSVTGTEMTIGVRVLMTRNVDRRREGSDGKNIASGCLGSIVVVG